jgi:LmbE family N-acetylglucosaminyl deacetylase
MNKFIFFFLITITIQLSAQQTEWNSARILLEFEKLNTTGSVLYIAAHPDDENTRLITYLANERKVRTGYLSLTRGDGGQNLVGEEQGAYLGLIRTQELMAARRLDGGEQFFTRAVDFGYSKSADETFSKWPHDSLLADVVWVIRNFRPDIIITRFPADERAGHGQHTVSAIIAEEAFAAAADPTKFPEQLKYVSVWQTQRIFWNNSTWWDKELPNKIANGDKNLVSFDTGGFNVLLGKSYGEIAAESRSNHKSQGFGATPVRGEQKEFLELKEGNALSSNTDLLADINTTWERYRQGVEIKIELEKIIADYDISHPEKSVDALLEVYEMLEKTPTDKLIEFKKQQCQNIIIACLGLWLEPVAEKYMVAQGDELKIFSTALKRNIYPTTLDSIVILDQDRKVGEILPPGINQMDTFKIIIPSNISSSPYWLGLDYDAMFNIPDQLMRGKPENDPAISMIYYLKIGTKEFKIKRTVVYKETDAVKGEIYKPLVIIPKAEIRLKQAVMIFSDDYPKDLKISLRSNVDNLKGYLFLSMNNGFYSQDSYQVAIEKKGTEQEFNFSVHVENAFVATTEAEIYFMIDGNNDQFAKLAFSAYSADALKSTIRESENFVYKTIETISHDHIPEQSIMQPAEVKIIKIDTKIPALQIAYIEGAGDKVDESLQQFGLNITTIKPEQITTDELKKYDAIVIGVRAYNVSKSLADNQQILMNYVKEGGLVITQYSTNWDSYADQLGPYPFKITRNRVTDENSSVDFLLPDHPVLNYPNKITKEDFNGWIQERGIYFTSDMAPEYKTPLAFTDPNEQPQKGSLIIADYGKGAFIYTGIVFFRELPSGVPGAYRLFVNMLSYKQSEK